jgi:hypothetical protein
MLGPIRLNSPIKSLFEAVKSGSYKVLFSYESPAKLAPIAPAALAVTETEAGVSPPEGTGWGFVAGAVTVAGEEDDPQPGISDVAASATAPSITLRRVTVDDIASGHIVS